MISKDEKGTFLAARCNYIPYAADVIITKEAMAIHDSLNYANVLGFSQVDAKSDSVNVIDPDFQKGMEVEAAAEGTVMGTRATTRRRARAWRTTA